MKCAAFKLEACLKEMEVLTKSLELYHQENSLLEGSVEVRLHLFLCATGTMGPQIFVELSKRYNHLGLVCDRRYGI